jgi:hypothetical protein
MCGMQCLLYIITRVVWKGIMCGMQGPLCTIIRGCVGGYNTVWDARSFVYKHKGVCGGLQYCVGCNVLCVLSEWVVWEARIMCGVQDL